MRKATCENKIRQRSNRGVHKSDAETSLGPSRRTQDHSAQMSIKKVLSSGGQTRKTSRQHMMHCLQVKNNTNRPQPLPNSIDSYVTKMSDGAYIGGQETKSNRTDPVRRLSSMRDTKFFFPVASLRVRIETPKGRADVLLWADHFLAGLLPPALLVVVRAGMLLGQAVQLTERVATFAAPDLHKREFKSSLAAEAAFLVLLDRSRRGTISAAGTGSG